jgi:hypothetical protein
MTTAERTPVPAQFRDKITPRQREYILGLLAERQLPERDDMPARLDSLMKSLRISEDPEEFGMGKKQASNTIEWLLGLPKKEAPSEETQTFKEAIPDGYYALRDLEGYKNEINFFRINTGKKGGRWEGFQFVTHIVAGEHNHAIKGDARGKVFVAIINQDAKKARELYGQEIGRCGVCNRMLTDDTSRALGIGPVCAGREGW